MPKQTKTKNNFTIITEQFKRFFYNDFFKKKKKNKIDFSGMASINAMTRHEMTCQFDLARFPGEREDER